MFKLASTAHDKPRSAEQASAATMNSISTGSAEQASAAHKRKQPPASSAEQASAATKRRQAAAQFAQYVDQEYQLAQQMGNSHSRYQLDRLFPKYRQSFNPMDLTRELSSIVCQPTSSDNWYASFILPIRVALRVKDTAVDWDTVFFQCVRNLNATAEHSTAMNVSQLYQLLEQANHTPKRYTLNRAVPQCNHHQVMQFLFSKGAEVPSRYLANSLFRRASGKNNVKLMRVLLKHAPITDFYTPLKEYLLGNGATITYSSPDALYCLLESGSASHFFNAALAFEQEPRIFPIVKNYIATYTRMISEYSSYYLTNKQTILQHCQFILPKDIVQHVFAHYV